MSPESYVLLLIGCWLLVASSTLWGILRISRRHYLELDYSETQTDLPPEPTEPGNEPAYRGFQFSSLRLRATTAIARLPSVIGPLHWRHRRIPADS
ncbi:hypothetical protein [Pseudomonas saliphila]|uniref:hypothetical protein n=1 Tax=Pseudomonas saliphila TaxID=2586906 RepID=UPI001238D00C|nr:hypothetical protein [Pseudomonas saliphila]